MMSFIIKDRAVKQLKDFDIHAYIDSFNPQK